MLRSRIIRAFPRPRTLVHNSRPYTRPYSSTPPTLATSQSRIERFNRRLPKFLHKYTNALANAPLSHITSFLLLHELTAVIPLFGLAGYFHYTHWLPPWFAEGAWIASGVETFGRYFKRKGWIRGEEAAEAQREVNDMKAAQEDGSVEGTDAQKLRKVDKAWNVGEGGVRLVVEFATAYAIVKMFLIPRIVFSVWATPAFARWTVIPATRRLRGLFGKKGKGVKDASGIGAVEGGSVSKSGKGNS